MKKKASSQASWSILSEGVSASRVEAHIVRSHVSQMVEAIKEHPKLAEEVFKRCGDNFEAIPKHLSKMERSLDRTNYALISMGSSWYRQRLTHEDREMVDMAAKYNPTPSPSINKHSEEMMRRNAGRVKDILINIIEKYEDDLLKFDPEFETKTKKFEYLWSGDFKSAIDSTSSRGAKNLLFKMKSDLDSILNRKFASEVIHSLEKRIAHLEDQLD